MGSSASKGPAAGRKPSRVSNKDNNNVTYKRRNIPRDQEDLEVSTDSNILFENVFLFTYGCSFSDKIPSECLKLEKTSGSTHPQLNKECIQQCLHQRLHLKTPEIAVVTTKTTEEQNLIPNNLSCADEPSNFRYLFQCYSRLKIIEPSFGDHADDVSASMAAITEASRDCLQTTDKLSATSHEQFIALCLENKKSLNDKKSRIHEFLLSVVVAIDEKGDATSQGKTWIPTWDRLKDWFKRTKLSNKQLDGYLAIFRFCSSKPSLAMAFMKYNEPVDRNSAPTYEQTLIGAALSVSSCPSKTNQKLEFFQNALDMSNDDIQASVAVIWQSLSLVCSEVYETLYNVTKHSVDHRHAVLGWLGHALEANRPKPDIWSAHEAEVFDQRYCSDGFCLNLCAVLLKFCKPFSVPEHTNLLILEPSYCRLENPSDEDAKQMCLHARGLSIEDTFIPHFGVEISPPAERGFRFATECFFMAQQALHIGCSMMFKQLKLNNDIGRLQKLLKDMKEIYPKKILDLIRSELNRGHCLFLNMTSALQNLTDDAFRFHIASASWLVQVASVNKPEAFQPVQLPLSEIPPTSLRCLPEFVMSNIKRLSFHLQLTNETSLLREHKTALTYYLSLVIMYMGDSNRLQSSDLRAGLAESLETLLPKMNEDGTWVHTQSGVWEDAVRTHPLISHLAGALIHVYVSIEMRGQSVDSEKMFNYRRSVHKLLQYVWHIPVHKEAVKKLAKDALSSIDNAEPPLFLRFINLLVNDSIFLLDEVFDYMKNIRAHEVQRDNGDWKNMSIEQLQEKESSLRNLKEIGRHRNTTANFTIYTLVLLTRELHDICCHPMMVDRLTGMLNYFLEHLVGPKQMAYKVNNRWELNFKPEQLVSDITHIYVYLGTRDEFCKSVLGETRSFSYTMFDSTIPVLDKIGVNDDFKGRFEEFVEKLKSLEANVEREEELMADVPEEFLDPIMGTLMADPVILPTSSTTVDKAVIARHLLSDESDPFNRQPLTMGMLKTDLVLKQRIENWKSEVMKQKPVKQEVSD